MRFESVINYIEDALRSEKCIPGCDLHIMQDHKTLLRYKSGYADSGKSKPVSENDLYFMYSCSKPITCTAALQLVERGVIDIEAPVSDYLPAFKDVYLIKDGKKSAPQNEMKIKHLFTMSAGLNYDTKAEPILNTVAQNPHAGTVDIVNSLVQAPLSFEPGTKYQYSLCHDVLGAIIEVTSGMKFSEYLRKNITGPLGMSDTGFHLSEDKAHRLSEQYRCCDDMVIRPVPKINEFCFTDAYESGGAGLYSSVDDYSIFADAMANGGVGANGVRILKEETIDLMRTEQLSSFSVDTAYSFGQDPGFGYGLGVRTRVGKQPGQHGSIGEFGWDGAAGAYVTIDPDNKLSFFFVMHVLSWPRTVENRLLILHDIIYKEFGL